MTRRGKGDFARSGGGAEENPAGRPLGPDAKAVPIRSVAQLRVKREGILIESGGSVDLAITKKLPAAFCK